MRHTPTLIIACVAAMICMMSACGRTENCPRTSTREIDSIANDYFARIYSDPAGVEADLTSLRSGISDSSQYYGLSGIIALSRLLQDDASGSDSILRSVRDYVVRHPDAGYASERYAAITGVINSLYGRNEAAADDFMLASNLARRYGVWSVVIKNLANVGELRELTGDPSGAVSILRDALLLADSTGRTEQNFSIRTRMATTYTSMGNYTEADRIFAINDSDVVEQSATDRFFYYSAKGNSYYYRDDYERSLGSFRQAASELPILRDPYMDAVTHANMGECFLFLNQLDSARYYIDLAGKEFDDIAVNDLNQIFYLNSLRGDLELRSGNTALARTLLLSIRPESWDVAPRYKALHHHRLQHFYATEGDYRNALAHQLKADEIDDSLERLVTLNYSSEVENRYLQDTTILHTRLRMLEKEEEISHLYMWIIGSVAVALIIIFGILTYHFVRRRKMARVEERLRASLLGMKLENARNRLSPHFIFNMLNDELPGDNVNIRNLVELMRMNLELCNRPTITLDDELTFIDTYMKVLRPSLGEGFRFEKEIDPTIDYSRIGVPLMLIQIFVENAVKHGLMGYDSPNKLLRLTIRRAASQIEITVANTAPASHQPTAPGTGTGMRVAAQTIVALNARNRRQMDLRQSVADLPDGRKLFSIILTIPDDFNYSTPVPSR